MPDGCVCVARAVVVYAVVLESSIRYCVLLMGLKKGSVVEGCACRIKDCAIHTFRDAVLLKSVGGRGLVGNMVF